MAEQLVSTESSTPLNKFSGAQPKNTKEVAFKVGQNIASMEVVALESTTGKYVTYAEGGSNGTNIAVGIAAYAVDATGAETNAQIYSAGSFNPAELVFSGTPTQVKIDSMFANSPIQLQTMQA